MRIHYDTFESVVSALRSVEQRKRRRQRVSEGEIEGEREREIDGYIDG